ncbi:uncharacterized protein Dvar_78590 [Desulfosarcina variabilis str. Montpellier]
MFAKSFPYAIYYEVVEKVAYVVAILPMQKDPAWISKQLDERR